MYRFQLTEYLFVEQNNFTIRLCQQFFYINMTEDRHQVNEDVTESKCWLVNIHLRAMMHFNAN